MVSLSNPRSAPFFATRDLVVYSLAGTEEMLESVGRVDLSADFQR
jgi:hypothetical protein